MFRDHALVVADTLGCEFAASTDEIECDVSAKATSNPYADALGVLVARQDLMLHEGPTGREFSDLIAFNVLELP